MSSPPPPPPPPPRADSLVLLGVVVGRRNRSKRLAFFDLDVAGAGRGGGAFDAAEARSRVAAVVASASVDAPPPSYSASPPPPPLPSRVEIIAKTRACGGGFEDDDALADARSRVLKLGNVVRARGRWTRRDDGEWSCACEGVELVSSWADANPGKHFSRPEEEGAAAAGGGGGGGGGGGAERRRDAPAASIDRTVVDDDDADPPPRPPCKFWLNQGVCHKGAACKYAHADDRGGRARAWIEARRARRRALAAEAGDPHGSDAVSKGKRAERFAEWLVRTFGVDALNAGDGVLDVAGGRGDVSFELYNRRGVKCTLVEPRARKLSKSQRKFLKNRPPSLGAGDADAPLCAQVRAEFEPATWDRYANVSVIVGMHPDQATEAIADFALRRDVPFAVVPCCVFPRLFPRRVAVAVDAEEEEEDGEEEDGTPTVADEGAAHEAAGRSEEGRRRVSKQRTTEVTERRQLVEYLVNKTRGKMAFLDFEGANQVVYSTTPPSANERP
jgi:hypothetical protein